MRVAEELRAYEAAGSLAEELPYWGWLDDGRTCLARSGELIAAGRITPAVTDGRTPEQIDRVLGLWQRLLSGLGPDARLYFHMLRRPPRSRETAVGSGSGVASLSARKRQAFLAERVQRLDAYVVWSLASGLRTAARSSRAGPLSRLAGWRKRRRSAQTYLASEIEAAADRFRAMIEASRSLVAEHTPVEMLEAAEGSRLLSELVNRPGTFWDGATGSGMNWRLALSELEAERSHLRLDGEPMILYSLLSPPGQAHANLLRELYCLDAVTTVSLEWRPWTVEAARRRIRSAQRHYFSRRYSMMAHAQDAQGTAAAMVDSAAAAESDRLGAALVELEADGVAYGEASLTVALHGELEEIERLDGDVRRLFAAHDAKVIREGYGQMPAWFARLPAQPRRRQVRKVFVSAGVAACLAPVFGPPRGNRKSRHLDREPLAVFETPWRTAYRYDLFAGDVGHTLILGATGSGKSFTLNFLLVEALKYDPRILILDLGGSYRWLTRFLGGRYLELAPGEAEPTLRLTPFALPATTRTFQFLTGWVLRLLKLGGFEASGADTSEIRARIEDLYALGTERRTLSVLAGSLPSAMWPALSRWTEGGAWGAFLDNAPAGATDIEFRDWQVIDLAGAAEHADLCEAALSYLLERMRLEIEDPGETARLKLMVVDEAWRYMQDPAVLNYLAEAAKTWRKKNAALVLATQSAVDVTGTAGASALLESIPTKLFLANAELPDEAGALFRLNDSEVERIRELTPKRELYLRRPDEAAVLRLEVDPESYWLYTSSPLDAERRAEAVAKHSLARALEALAGRRPPHPTNREDVNTMRATPTAAILLGVVVVLLTVLLTALPCDAAAQQATGDEARLTVPDESGDRIHRLRARVRHTTLIVLPAGERILDFVVGDSEYWHLTGAANVAYLKPLAEAAATNVALVCESGRIYSFLVSEHADDPAHLVFRVEAGAEAAGMSGGAGGPAFVARSEVAAYREMAAEAAEASRTAQEQAEAGILEAQQWAEAEVEAFRAEYPARLAFEYRLDRRTSERPFLVEAMWHDGRFTYIRSRAQESPALYETKDGEPGLVAYDLTEDGLYVARRVLGDGWLQIGDRRAGWRFEPREGSR